MQPQPGELAPGHAPIDRLVQRRVLRPGVHGIRVGRGRLQVPDPLELPGPLRAVIPEVRARVADVAEVVADRLPAGPAVIGPLDQLPEPPRVLRRVQPVRVNRRPLHVVYLPPTEVWAGYRPLLPLAVRSQQERALARPSEHSYLSHRRRHSFPKLGS